MLEIDATDASCGGRAVGVSAGSDGAVNIGDGNVSTTACASEGILAVDTPFAMRVTNSRRDL